MYDEDEDDMFERKGSALRKATSGNPRIYPCPTCGKPNKLTLQDVRLHYQCDECADRDEGKGYFRPKRPKKGLINSIRIFK